MQANLPARTILRHDAVTRTHTKCLLAITYDQHGGYHDHVSPPTTTDDLPEFQQLGFRVPSLVVGPLVKKGFLCKTVLDHVSVLATITRRFGLEPLNAQVAAAADLSVVLDPALAKSLRAPSPVPAVELSAESRTPAPGVHAGGQVELARFIERHYPGFDWRAEGRRSMRVIRDAALRLGAARLRAR